MDLARFISIAERLELIAFTNWASSVCIFVAVCSKVVSRAATNVAWCCCIVAASSRFDCAVEAFSYVAWQLCYNRGGGVGFVAAVLRSLGTLTG